MSERIGLTCVLLVSIAACSQPQPVTPLTRNTNWFTCEKRLECVIVVDNACRRVAVNRRFAQDYLDWSASLVGSGESLPCEQTGLPEPRSASCHRGQCVEGIRFKD